MKAPAASSDRARNTSATRPIHKAKPMAACGTLAFVVTVILLLALRKQAMKGLNAVELAAMFGFILTAMLVGWFLGGPGKETRSILATASSMRNAALALMIAISSFPDLHVDVAVIAFSGLMIPPNMLFTVYHVVQDRRSRKHGDADAHCPWTHSSVFGAARSRDKIA